MAEPRKGTTTAFRFPESGLARLVGFLTAGPASKFVTDVTPPGTSLLHSLGLGGRSRHRDEWHEAYRPKWP